MQHRTDKHHQRERATKRIRDLRSLLAACERFHAEEQQRLLSEPWDATKSCAHGCPGWDLFSTDRPNANHCGMEIQACDGCRLALPEGDRYDDEMARQVFERLRALGRVTTYGCRDAECTLCMLRDMYPDYDRLALGETGEAVQA